MTKKNYTKKENIFIKGARLHNLKNLTLTIPKNKLIVISGVSGSGKSSLAFNTLFAEGQRRYIESLSSYARQFLGKIQKPDVDQIEGICPAISIEQKVITRNPRSTIGTTSEIYDYLKLLFARIGKTFSPISKKQVKKDRISDVCDFILKQRKKKKVLILAEYPDSIDNIKLLEALQKQGFSRVMIGSETHKIYNLLSEKKKVNEKIKLVIDRLILEQNNDIRNRITDSLETAFYEGKGRCIISIDSEEHFFSNRFELDGMNFEDPSIHLFAFNNPYGACPKCEGFGSILGIDEKKVIVNNTLSVYEGAVSCWSGKKLSRWKDRFIEQSAKYKFPVHKAYKELNTEQKNILWNGKEKCKGIKRFFRMLEREKYKIQNRVLIARYRGKTKCDECNGSRLRKDASYVKINGKTITQVVDMDINSAFDFFKSIKITEQEKNIADRLIQEISTRLYYLKEVGLGYLTLNRKSSTLSGGESQRINIATSIGSSLVGAMYILDEPSIGLHPKDTQQLIKVLMDLKHIGNTVIVVEHDEEIMQQADQIIDLGPRAGLDGGEIVFQGSLIDIFKENRSLTTQYLSGKMKIEIPEIKRKWSDSIILKGVNQYNLTDLDVEFPLNTLTVITGVSGSGKSTLVKEVLKPALANFLGIEGQNRKNLKEIKVSTQSLKKIEFIDQNPIGKSSRSNPATYIKAYDEIRLLFAKQDLSKVRKYTSGFFSFNVEGGRCEHCKGEGEVTVEMQFMADVYLECEHCKGFRFKKEILDVQVGGKNIAEILELSVTEAISFFHENKAENISRKLEPLEKVGLGYVKLGQSSNTLSGGEAQRIKLGSFLSKGKSYEKTLFIFDEPTTGLHFHDIKKLLDSFYALIEKGHSVICIEHNLDVIKCSDWVIDLGPGGGNKGGNIMFTGDTEGLLKCKSSETGKFLKMKLSTNYNLNNPVE